MTVQQNKPNDPGFARELSPESRKYVGPPPPCGTKRRPPKASNISGISAIPPREVGQFDYGICAAHIDTLKPQENKMPLHELTKRWLSTPGTPLPMSADSRIHIWMHHNSAYDAESNDFKTIDLINGLRKGTEIEELGPYQYTDMEARVLDRFQLLSKDLFYKNFIETADGRYEKTKLFLQCWRNRHTWWGDNPSPNTIKHKSRERDIYDVDSIYDNDAAPATASPKKLSSKLPKTSNLSKSDAISDTNSRKEILQNSSSENCNAPPAKRLKTSSNSTLSDAIIESSTIENIPSRAISTRPGEMGRDDAEDIKNAMDFLSSPTPEARQSTPQLPNPLNQPMTPTSPTPTLVTVACDKYLSTPLSLIVKIPDSRLNGSTLSAHTPITPSRNLEISINFQSRAGNYNLRQSVPASRLRQSSLPVFFELVSERSGVPAESLDCLTFRYNFVGSYVEVINKTANESEWEELKHNMRRLYRYSRERFPRKRDFDVWVDLGNTRDVVEKEEEEDLGGL